MKMRSRLQREIVEAACLVQAYCYTGQMGLESRASLLSPQTKPEPALIAGMAVQRGAEDLCAEAAVLGLDICAHGVQARGWRAMK